MDHAHRQRTIAARSDAEPEVRLFGHSRLTRIDDDDFRATRFGAADS
jgi:hypothetical protein